MYSDRHVLLSLNNTSKRVEILLLDYIVIIARYLYLLCNLMLFIAKSSAPVYCKWKLAWRNLTKGWVMVYSLKVSQSYQHTVLSAAHICQPILRMITSKRPYYLSRIESRSDLCQTLTPSFRFELKESTADCREKRSMSWLGGSDTTRHHYQVWDTHWLWI